MCEVPGKTNNTPASVGILRSGQTFWDLFSEAQLPQKNKRALVSLAEMGQA